jgi:carboxymethylenebutenolidase
MGETLTLKASDGHQFSAYRATPKDAPKGGLVVIQEIFGVNSHIQEVCDGFAADGYLAIAPALFDRVERGVEIGYTPADIERGRTLRAKVPAEGVLLDVAAALEAVKQAKNVGKIGIVGYCWGGTVAWLAAADIPGFAAAVSYYGGGIAEAVAKTPKMPTMLHFGAMDQSIPLSDVEKIRQRHPKIPLFVYDDAGHGFSCDHRGSFNAAAAKIARERTMAFFGEHLGG